MSDVIADDDGQTDTQEAAPAKKGEDQEIPEDRCKLVQRIVKTIKSDKAHHEKSFKRMKRDMFVAFHGREETWSEKNYKANIAGRHVKQKTAALYAKNPKATAKRAERLDFAVWDETAQSLMLAMQTIQAGLAITQQHAQESAMAAAPTAPPMPDASGTIPPAGVSVAGSELAPGVDTGAANVMLGHNGGPPMPLPPPQMPPGFDEARALVADFQQGMTRRQAVDKVGKTLEILFAKALREQKPLDFKAGMKTVVRRAITTGPGYIELGFQREYGPRPGMTEHLADSQARLAHLKNLMEEANEGDILDCDAEMAELTLSIAALQAEPEVVTREGLIFDYPRSTKVIPDKICKMLIGFVGARHVTIEYEYTQDEVKELFDVEIKKFTGYTADGKGIAEVAGDFFDEDGDSAETHRDTGGLIRVWKHYDKPSGLVYYVADGHPDFLREPAAPDVFVEDFWPIYALAFNESESEDELFPASDVTLMLDMQREHNRSRQGKREHRDAARPRWGYAKGAITEGDAGKIGNVKPFEAVGLNIDPATKLADVLQAFPVPGVDPNLYDTNETFADVQLVVGSQQAQMGGLSKATATETAISASATASADGSSSDELDAFITIIARASGQILLKEMSEEKVMQEVGPGASWPHMSLAEIAGEVYLEVEAGSTGKPNQAVEINNWKNLLPLLIQMGSIDPVWLAKETLRRLDDKMDLTAAIAAGIPSIVAQNSTAGGQQPPADNPANAPGAQGAQGGNKTPRPAVEQPGSGPAFGSNQV